MKTKVISDQWDDDSLEILEEHREKWKELEQLPIKQLKILAKELGLGLVEIEKKHEDKRAKCNIKCTSRRNKGLKEDIIKQIIHASQQVHKSLQRRSVRSRKISARTPRPSSKSRGGKSPSPEPVSPVSSPTRRTPPPLLPVSSPTRRTPPPLSKLQSDIALKNASLKKKRKLRGTKSKKKRRSKRMKRKKKH